MKTTARIRNLRRGSTASTAPAYKDPALAPEKRVRDLLARMTLEEKAAPAISARDFSMRKTNR